MLDKMPTMDWSAFAEQSLREIARLARLTARGKPYEQGASLTRAAQDAEQLAKELGAARYPIRFTCRQVLVHMVDHYRSSGDTEKVRKLEAIIRSLKSGEKMLVSGDLAFRAKTLSELDNRLEDMRKIAVPIMERGAG